MGTMLHRVYQALPYAICLSTKQGEANTIFSDFSMLLPMILQADALPLGEPMLHIKHVTRKPVFRVLQPGMTQTDLLSYQD